MDNVKPNQSQLRDRRQVAIFQALEADIREAEAMPGSYMYDNIRKPINTSQISNGGTANLMISPDESYASIDPRNSHIEFLKMTVGVKMNATTVPCDAQGVITSYTQTDLPNNVAITNECKQFIGYNLSLNAFESFDYFNNAVKFYTAQHLHARSNFIKTYISDEVGERSPGTITTIPGLIKNDPASIAGRVVDMKGWKFGPNKKVDFILKDISVPLWWLPIFDSGIPSIPDDLGEIILKNIKMSREGLLMANTTRKYENVTERDNPLASNYYEFVPTGSGYLTDTVVTTAEDVYGRLVLHWSLDTLTVNDFQYHYAKFENQPYTVDLLRSMTQTGPIRIPFKDYIVNKMDIVDSGETSSTITSPDIRSDANNWSSATITYHETATDIVRNYQPLIYEKNLTINSAIHPPSSTNNRSFNDYKDFRRQLDATEMNGTFAVLWNEEQMNGMYPLIINSVADGNAVIAGAKTVVDDPDNLALNPDSYSIKKKPIHNYYETIPFAQDGGLWQGVGTETMTFKLRHRKLPVYKNAAGVKNMYAPVHHIEVVAATDLAAYVVFAPSSARLKGQITTSPDMINYGAGPRGPL